MPYGNPPEVAQQIKVVAAVDAGDKAAGAINGAVIDRSEFHSLDLVAMTGAATGGPATQTLDVKLQHGDANDGSDAVDFTPDGTAASGAIAQITAVSTLKHKSINLRGAKKYIRAVATVGLTGGASPKLGIGVALVLGAPRATPTNY